jgi:hypothetical protein
MKEATEILAKRRAQIDRWLEPGSGPYGPHLTAIVEPQRTAAGPVWSKT